MSEDNSKPKISSYYKKVASEKEFYLTMSNRPLPKNKSSKYRGVQKANNPKNPFKASFTYARKRYYLGGYPTEIEAAKAYNKAVLLIVGEHAILNDIPEEEETK